MKLNEVTSNTTSLERICSTELLHPKSQANTQNNNLLLVRGPFCLVLKFGRYLTTTRLISSIHCVRARVCVRA